MSTMTRSAIVLICVAVQLSCIYGRNVDPNVQYNVHPMPKETIRSEVLDERGATYWNEIGQDILKKKLQLENNNVAKNVIFFIGDGMSIPTLAAARTYMGQLEGLRGEEYEMSFEQFPVTGLVKTYCVDYQVADSACTATAYLAGIKNNYGTTGVTANVSRYDCEAENLPENRVDSIAAWAIEAGKDAGLVTTTTVTHASPSGLYAHTSNRDWERDTLVIEDQLDPAVCHDIAHQLVNQEPGKHLKVILGGGRRNFFRYDEDDSEGVPGERTHENLVDAWAEDKEANGFAHEYVYNREQLLNVDTAETEYLLGLFESHHLQYQADVTTDTEPTLAEMTKVAIEILSRNDKGYFLFVEGGRIDHAHHDNLARQAMSETAELAKAIQLAVDMTSEEDTLIVTSSDHSHVMTVNGYPRRGNDIVGPSMDLGDDGMTYMTLSYTNGPGHLLHEQPCSRIDPITFDLDNVNMPHPAEVPRYSETHGGDDVAVFARGPYQHLFTGLYEQNALPHMMAYAACIGPGLTACSSSPALVANVVMLVAAFVVQRLHRL